MNNLFFKLFFILLFNLLFSNTAFAQFTYDGWSEYKCRSIVLSLPGKLSEYRIKKGASFEKRKNSNAYYCNLDKKWLTIGVSQRKGKIHTYLQKVKKEYSKYNREIVVKKINFKGHVVFYYEEITAMYGIRYYVIMFSEKKNWRTSIRVGLRQRYINRKYIKYTKQELLFAKKILFKTKIISNNSNSIYTINAPGGLRMRSGPGLGHAAIGVVPNKRKVIFIKTSGPEKTIAGKTGRWTKVKWKGKTGWVFGGFLEVVK